MRRATVTVPVDLEQPLEAYIADQEATPSLTAVMQAALRDFLRRRGYAEPKSLHVPIAPTPSEFSDTSVRHDEVLAEITAEAKLGPRK